MKAVKAFIRCRKAEAVIAALEEEGISDITLIDVMGLWQHLIDAAHAKYSIKCVEKYSEANIDLVAAVETNPDSADYYGCRMSEHSHIRSDKPGKCPECNMKLVPMRLEKKQ